MRAFLAIVAVGLGTYASRSLFILALANRRIPSAVIAALEYVAPAVLAALVVSLLIDAEGRLDFGPAEMVAFIVGGATVFRTRNFLLAAALGMAAFWGVGAFF